MSPPPHARPPLARRWVLRVALAGLALLVASLGTGLWLLRDPEPRFAERRTSVDRVLEEPAVASEGHLSQAVRVEGANGLAVDLLLRWPDPAADREEGAEPRRRPLFLILGGYRTGEQAASLLSDTERNVIAAVGYPYDGPLDLKGVRVVRHVPRIRRALLDTPPALQLALDYLLEHPEVDPERVELVGVSFGSFFTAITAALDPRVDRLWLVHGAGRPYTLIEHNLRRSIPSAALRRPVAALANVLAGGPVLAPERWVPRVHPRPIVLINATDDERLPRRAVESLHASAREPVERIWLPGLHVQPNRQETIQELVDVVLGRAVAGSAF